MASIVMKLGRFRQHGRIGGFKVAFTGRFTRRERLTYKWKQYGKVTLSSKKHPVDYENKVIQLSHGVCLIEI